MEIMKSGGIMIDIEEIGKAGDMTETETEGEIEIIMTGTGTDAIGIKHKDFAIENPLNGGFFNSLSTPKK
jgi:hypothetical protein